MKRFLWFNLEKIKKDVDYFLMSFLFLVIVQLAFYTPTGISGKISIPSGIATSIFFLYVVFSKKEFSYKEAWECFWKF